MMSLYDGFYNGESDAMATGFGATGFIGAIEALEVGIMVTDFDGLYGIVDG